MLILGIVSEIRESKKEKQGREDEANVSLFKEMLYRNPLHVNENLVSQAILKPRQTLNT